MKRWCSVCKRVEEGGKGGLRVQFDPATRWWLCDDCLKKQRQASRKKPDRVLPQS